MNIVTLASRLDLTEASGLAAALNAHSGQPVTLDAGNVEHLGGLCLQVLLAAARQWRETTCEFAITPRSAPFSDALTIFGVDPSEFGEEIHS
ncbi:STAS domain-containing protein [Paracoccus aminophilus]|uniref:STAS domain-containing protein n=1 Tax=Paracoccus aminophilus TaxID=34003 RepID=UPI00059F9D37|nr:STAS domain-containing protein [Paracoccus aminophilus]